MATTDMSSQYINTMVFAVVAGIMSLMLLLLIMYASDTVGRYSVFIITIEAGLILVIAFAIYKIIAYENKRNKEDKNGTENRLAVTNCPDYWTQAQNSTCKGNFIPNVTSRGKYVRYTILGTTIPAKPYEVALAPKTVDLSTYNNLTVQKACAKLTDAGSSVHDVPWTDVRAVCDSYRIGG